MRSIATTDYTRNADFPIKVLAEKDKVLAFMRGPAPFFATAGRFEDATTGKTVCDRAWGWYRHGDWQWSDRDAYHVEKYDLELEPEFVDYALRHLDFKQCRSNW